MALDFWANYYYTHPNDNNVEHYEMDEDEFDAVVQEILGNDDWEEVT